MGKPQLIAVQPIVKSDMVLVVLLRLLVLLLPLLRPRLRYLFQLMVTVGLRYKQPVVETTAATAITNVALPYLTVLLHKAVKLAMELVVAANPFHRPPLFLHLIQPLSHLSLEAAGTQAW